MIEQIIYWTGVVALLCVLMAVILVSVAVILEVIVGHLVKGLKSTYNHIQLHYFMRQLKAKGYAQSVDEIGEGGEK